MKVLDLFSGIGGFSLGLERAGMKTVAFCEFDKKCRRVLKKHWPDVPVYDDVRTLTYEQLKKDGIEAIDVICGGFPCQPFSVAGKQAGTEDDRFLWPEMYRLVKEVNPAWVIVENVTGIINMALEQVLSDLESAGYKTQTFIIPACGINAPHKRDRVWIVAYPHKAGLQAPWSEFATKRLEQYRIVQRQVMWPTPTKTTPRDCQAERNRRTPGLESAVKMFATPQARDFRHGQQSRWEDPQRSRNLNDQVAAMYSTPTTQDASNNGGKSQHNRNSLPLNAQVGGKLNPDWVEQLMGFPLGWTDMKLDDISRENMFPQAWDDGSWETGIPRVTMRTEGRVTRLKQLGNAVVPQIPEIIGRAIMEMESNVLPNVQD